MADPSSLESLHNPYARKILDALVVPPPQTVTPRIRPDSSRNAASNLTAVLCHRLAQSSPVTESSVDRGPSGKTTFAWKEGGINFRNIVGKKSEFWTNLILNYANQLHASYQSVPLVFVTTSWRTTDEVIHLWAIPEPIIYDALLRIPAGRTANKKTIKIRPEMSRILADPKAEDLSSYYRKIDLTNEERAILRQALEADDEARKNRQAEEKDGEDGDGMEETYSPTVTDFWLNWTSEQISALRSSPSMDRTEFGPAGPSHLALKAHSVARELVPGLHWHTVDLPAVDTNEFPGLAILDDRESVEPLSGLGIVLRTSPGQPGAVQLSVEWHPPAESTGRVATVPRASELLSQSEARQLTEAGLTLASNYPQGAPSGSSGGGGEPDTDAPRVLAYRHVSAADLMVPETQPTEVLESMLQFLQTWCNTRHGEPAPRPNFLETLRRYQGQNIVFYPADRSTGFVIQSVDATGCEVRSITGGLSDRVTLEDYQQFAAGVAGGIDSGAASQKLSPLAVACYQQGPDLGSASVGEQPPSIPDDSSAIQNLIELIENLRSPELYKPAVLDVVLDGLERGELVENKIEFDWVVPRFIEQLSRLGREVTESQAAEGFGRLASDGFWLLAYHDPATAVLGERVSPKQVRTRITHASLKEPYWQALANRHQRRRVRNALARRWWPEALTAGRRPSLEGLDVAVRELVTQIDARGFVFEPWQIAAYVTAVRTKPFVILAGVSGTGKSKLPALVAEAAGAARPRRIAVRPDWTDSSDVMGYVDLQDRFRPGLVLQSLREASSRPDQFHVCLVDEMNLARVEHYFAEFLSAVEDRLPAPGGGYESSPILTQSLSQDAEQWQNQRIPPNLAIVGTVNMDESTHGFSRKVLDRAFTLELSEVDLATHATSPARQRGSSLPRVWPRHFWDCPAARILDLDLERADIQRDVTTVIETLSEINRSLLFSQLQVGYRTRDEVALFVVNARSVKSSFVTRTGVTVDPLDLALLMKILPRVVGGSNSIRRTLLGLLGQAHDGRPLNADDEPTDILRAWERDGRPAGCAEARFPRTAARLCLMWERLNAEGYTSFWL